MDCTSLYQNNSRTLQIMKVDLITVVYDAEVYLLEWQAKSIAKYFPSERINNIIIVDNGSQHCKDNINTDWYKQNKNKVVFQNHKELEVKMYEHLDGWRTQQLCKLLSAATSQMPYSIILDAKTFFAKTFKFDKIILDNKPQTGWKGTDGIDKNIIDFLSKYFKIDFSMQLEPGGIPTFLHSETVRQLINYIPNFKTWFQDHVCTPFSHKTLVLEFALYSAFLLKKYKDFTTLYGNQYNIMPMNIADWEMKHNPSKFNDLFLDQWDTISIKEEAKKYCSTEQLEKWKQFLYEKYN